jgi:hypothetical protein
VLLAQIATPLVYLAAAAGLAAAAHRWVLPVSRRAALALLLLPLCFTGKAFLTGGVYAPISSAYSNEPFAAIAAELGVEPPPAGTYYDLYGQIIPWQRAVRHAWSLGEWPLRNPFVLCGDALAGTAQPAPFYPPNVLALVLPLPLAVTFLAALAFFLAALGAYLLARDLGCREAVAVITGAGWMAMNGTVFWIGWPIGVAMPLLPLVLLGARRLAREPGPRSCLLLTAVLAGGFLAGHPETSVHHAAVGGLWGLWEALRQPRRRWQRILAFGALGALLTLGLTAISSLLVADTLSQTFQWQARRHLVDPGAASWGEVVTRLVPNLVPFAHGFWFNRVPELPRFFASFTSAYLGSVLLAPALYGLLRGRRPERWALAALGLFGLAAGLRVPGFYPALERLPLFDMSINDRLIACAGLAAALLAALGLEEWCRRERPAALGQLAAALLAPLALAVALLWPPMRDGGLAPGFLAAHAALLLLPAAAALPFLLVRRLRPVALAALLGLLLAQRVAETAPWRYPTAPAAAFYPPAAPVPGPAPAERPGRLVGVGHVLMPNQGAHYLIEDPRGYQAVHHLRYHQLLPLWTADPPGSFLQVRNLGRPFLSLLNVRWALDLRGARRPDGWQLIDGGPSARLWRNPRALERAFLPARVRLASLPQQVLAEMKEAADFAQVAWIETPDALYAHPLETANGAGEVAIRRDGLGYRLDADLESAAWVVISEVAWRGWRAESAGRELPLAIADHAFLGLHLPAGVHEVELFYRPRSFEIGLAITATTVAGMLAWGLVAAWRRRKRAGAPAAGADQPAAGDGPSADAASARTSGSGSPPAAASASRAAAPPISPSAQAAWRRTTGDGSAASARASSGT